MRYIPIDELIALLDLTPSGKKDLARLSRAQRKLALMLPKIRQDRLKRNGVSKWSPIKKRWVAFLGNKCWYTETILVGAHQTMDHFRPKASYWWLAYDPENFRVCCSFCNSKEPNHLYGRTGGKGDAFPLRPLGVPATSKAGITAEEPVLLDPCNRDDFDLLSFQSDGRPVINPAYANDDWVKYRVEESKLLLNLDHQHFNSEREQLFRSIKRDVRSYNVHAVGSSDRDDIYTELKTRVSPESRFSMAARQYLATHREHEWVERLLAETAYH